VNAGELRHKVTIQELQRVLATVWAKIQPLRGNERYQAQQVSSALSHKIILRYLDGVKPQMRVLYGSRVFYIVSVINVEERNEMLELLCEEEIV